MKDVTIVITAFTRYGPLKACLRSIRKYYPCVPIIISDNGRMKSTVGLALKFRCRHLELPYDCGANMARKKGQEAVETKYWVICEDDMIFTKDTVLENFKTVLDHDPQVDVIGGPAIRNNRIGTIGSTFEIDREKKTFFRTPIRKPDLRTADGVLYYLCDFTRMFFMARKETPIDWEEKDYLGSGTHITIALKNYIKKQESLRERESVSGDCLPPIWPWYQHAFTYSVAVSHVQVPESPGYKHKRSRVRGQMNLLCRDTGLRYGVFDGKRVRDYQEQVSISYEEWEKRTRGK